MRYAVFPLTLLLALLFATAMSLRGQEAALLVLPLTVFALSIALLCERWLPRQAIPAQPGEVRTDWAFVVITALADAIAASALAYVATWPAVHQVGVAGDWPLWVAVPTALMLWELGAYVAHRLAHEWTWLWRLHALHHAPKRMTVLNNFRLHPLDFLLKTALSMLPLLLIGFSSQAVALVGIIRGVVVAFQHSDADLRHGSLNSVFATNSVHRWHHSTQANEANANYGTVLVLWDHLFGTFRVRDERQDPTTMGLFDTPHYPTHELLRPLLAFLCWQRCTAEPDAHAPNLDVRTNHR